MQKIWNWLMQANAKALFLACLLALLAMVGWRGYVEIDAVRTAEREAYELANKPPEAPPKFPEYESLGILEYVDAQTKQDGRALPVDLFRPSLEAMVSNLVDYILNAPDDAVRAQTPGDQQQRATNQGGGQHGGGQQDDDTPLFVRNPRTGAYELNPASPRFRQPPPLKLSFKGVFKRTDGVVSVMVGEANSGLQQFAKVGDTLFGATLVSTDVGEIGVRGTANDEVVVIKRGETGEVPLKAEPVPERPQRQENARQPGGQQGQGGGNRPQRRMPTEEELQALERTNPELAKRIRDAIARRQAQEKQP